MGEREFLKSVYSSQELEGVLLDGLDCDALLKVTKIKSKDPSKIYKILLKEQLIEGKALLPTLAKYFKCDFVDLKKQQSDPKLMVFKDFEYYVRHSFLPWKKVGKMTYVAITELTDDLFCFLKSKYKNGFRLVLVTQEAITFNLQKNFSISTLNEVKAAHQKYNVAIVIAFLLTVVCASFFIIPIIYILYFINFLFFTNLLFKFLLIKNSVASSSKQNDKGHLKLKYEDLPVYSIIVPLKAEAKVLPRLLKSIKSLNYPKSKLDLVFVIDQFDRDTIVALKKLKFEGLFKVVCVPISFPCTKPKVCSYALKYTLGEYVCVYDAEDVPDKDQLLKAVYTFKSCAPDVVCLQAKLNYYNPLANSLSYFFSIEYGVWFEFFLPSLERLNVPLPLGGTSNHIKASFLKMIGGWDPYNVTEDADLGYRIAEYGFKTKVLDSVTLEESPTQVPAWLSQRSRWMKGHIYTYIAHLKNMRVFKKNAGLVPGVLGFHYFLIVPILCYYAQIILIAFSSAATFSLKIMMILNFALSYVFCVLSVWLVCARIDLKLKKVIALMYPFYYFLHSVAAVMALAELIFRPHYWSKTKHEGFSNLQNTKEVM